MYSNRDSAGRTLAALLKEHELHNPLVLGIPRGGVIVAAAVAKALDAELDVILARKLRASGNPELAIGAVSEEGAMILNERVIEAHKIQDAYVEAERALQMELIAVRQARYRAVRPAADMTGRTVIVVDDGIATGSTMIAALQAVRRRGPREIIATAPVACPDAFRQIAAIADHFHCPLTPQDFAAVGDYYRDFRTINDDDVVDFLEQFSVPVRTDAR
jgi:putative phosphoribosyl transferase